MTRTIVMIHPGGVGDLLLAVPAIQCLRTRFPQHEFLLCGHDQASEVLQECGLIERAISVQAAACLALFAGTALQDALLKDWLSRCDLAVAWTRDESGRLAGALKHSGAVSVVAQSPFDSTLATTHQSDRFLEILKQYAPRDSAIERLSLPAHARENAATSLSAYRLPGNRPLVLIHPGSGSPHKCVDSAVLAAVTRQLGGQGFVPLVVEGPADAEPVELLLSHLSTKPVVLSGLSFSLLAGILSQVELFLGHDSGVSHLAALVGVPTVALFGPTSPARWGPRGANVVVVQGEPCRCHSWNEVSRCAEKPCMRILSEAIMVACRTLQLPA